MPPTTTTRPYGTRIARYFEHIKGDYHFEDVPDKKDASITTKQKVYDREPEPPTLTGLALFLGFTSLQAFEVYEQTGFYAAQLQMGRLMIEAEYEKRLHYQSATGAIFALKTLGWKEQHDQSTGIDGLKSISITITTSGPKVAQAEKEVDL
ncbi:terminase small subunit [Mucilaginibacter conchicola]|nr:terminase small subunit [Mucilaginibacter conchicola]